MMWGRFKIRRWVTGKEPKWHDKLNIWIDSLQYVLAGSKMWVNIACGFFN